jgi:hypothetical protein
VKGIYSSINKKHRKNRILRAAYWTVRNAAVSTANAFWYLYEIPGSLFDESVRIRFAGNWWPGAANPKVDWLGIFGVLDGQRQKYRVVKSYAPAIEIFSTYSDRKILENSKAKCKIFYTGENVHSACDRSFYAQYADNCVNDVDLSLGFDNISAENYIRYPNWAPRFFPLNSSKDKIKTILDDFKKKHRKTKFCSLVSSHDKSGLRTKIYNEISQIAPIDCPGKLLRNDDTLRDIYNNNKNAYLQQYKFNICPENTISEGYCTEKIFECLYSGCIPVYNGGSRDPEPGIINSNIILWYDYFDEESNRSTFNEIKKLHSDDLRYRSFMEQPFFCDAAVDKIYDMLQRLNNKLRCVCSPQFLYPTHDMKEPYLRKAVLRQKQREERIR